MDSGIYFKIRALRITKFLPRLLFAFYWRSVRPPTAYFTGWSPNALLIWREDQPGEYFSFLNFP